ncbi:MAG: class E sortase [Actinomycetota bacterium]|nr:class E sortase [Actinomycetota bacterium]
MADLIACPAVGVRRVIRGLGKTLICFGVLLFLFVAYQLWGTGISERREQKELAAAFEQSQLTTPPTLPGPLGTTSEDTAPPPPDLGASLGLLEIPKIDVKKFLVEGVGVEDLKKGPGHYPETPMPGEKGNSAIAGHRTTYGAPFDNLDELAPGDEIFVTTAAGRFRYAVSESLIVDPIDGAYVLEPTEDDRLTLTTCNPRFSAAERLIVIAKLMSNPVQSAPRPEPDPAVPAAPGAQLDAGLSGAGASNTPAVLWGSLAAAIWLGAWLLGRAWRRWPAYTLGAIPFFVALFIFYENVARLLPANV